jgi:hypothetical protein
MTRDHVPAAGFAYVGLAAVAFVLLSVADDGEDTIARAALAVYVVAAFAFAWFLGALRGRLIRYDPNGLFASVVALSGAAFLALQGAGVAALAAAVDRAERDVFWTFSSVAAAGAAAVVVSSSVAALYARRVARWFGRAGVAGGTAILATGAVEAVVAPDYDFVFPLSALLFMGWVVVVSVNLLRHGSVRSRR